MSSSTKINNVKKDFLIIDKRATQGWEHTLSSEKMYSISFNKNKKTFCLRLHYNGANSSFLVNGEEIHEFWSDSEIFLNMLCLGNISKDFSSGNMKKKNRIKWLCLSC